jgi:hypothetical protein
MSSSRAKQNRPSRRLTAVYRRGFEDGRRVALDAALSAAEPVSPAIKAIAAERRRQIEQEGWSADHDDAHCDGSIALAAACYAMFAAVSDNARRSTQLPRSLTNDGQAVEGWAAFLSIWPWERHFWKPTTRVRDLEKAGALIAAELDRVIRAAAPAKQEGKRQ